MPDMERKVANVAKAVDDMLCEAQMVGKLCGVNSVFTVMYEYTGQMDRFVDVLSQYQKKGATAREVLCAFNTKGENILVNDYIEVVAKAAYAYLNKQKNDTERLDKAANIGIKLSRIEHLIPLAYKANAKIMDR